MNKDRAEYLVMNIKMAKDMTELREAVSILIRDEVYCERAKDIILAKAVMDYLITLSRKNELVLPSFILALIVENDEDVINAFERDFDEIEFIDMVANNIKNKKNKTTLVRILNRLLLQ